ncbi:MAG TPA: N-acetylmuramoyl-L-alanine amidase, partial [Saprospiraceae bacterium]|nr:N-acetylmuramoyl-L-alanine amidase [Saprospiraceae bacterium]
MRLNLPILVLTIFLGFAPAIKAQQPYKVRKVVIDAGHGGKDPGCHGLNSKEKDVALAVALNVGASIKAAFPEVEVIYTRETDVFIPLNERAAIANRNQADLFISIHCNYIGVRNRATGTETYVLGLHRAEDNLEVAKRENAAILLEDDYEKTYNGFDPYSPEGHIILSMFQNAHLEQSISFATQVQGAVKKFSELQSRGVKQAGFLVLRETTMPSVLIETGFLSTDVDENYLVKKENQQEMASCIFKAFSQYKKQMEESDVAVNDGAVASTDTILETGPTPPDPPKA